VAEELLAAGLIIHHTNTSLLLPRRILQSLLLPNLLFVCSFCLIIFYCPPYIWHSVLTEYKRQ
jgi:hypothetical protein